MGFRITMLSTGFPRFEGDLFGFFVADLARTLSHRGHQVEVVAPGEKGVPVGETRDGVRIRRVTYARPRGLMKLAYGGGLVPNLRARPYLAALLPQFLACLGLSAARRAVGADIFHGQWVVSGWLGLATRFIHGKPVVVTFRGSDLAILRALPNRLAARLLRGLDLITTVSQEIREAVLELGLPKERVRLIPNGVDTGLFRPGDKRACRKKLGLDPDSPMMLYAGRLSPEKGVFDLVQAAPTLIQDCPSAQIIILGDGTLKEALQKEIKTLGLEGSVRLHPAVPRLELTDWYNAADLVCLPSHREGRPNTVLEAQACGRPILSTAVGGVPELIDHGVNGHLVPPREPKKFGRAAAALLNDPAKAKSLGDQGPATLERLGLTWTRSAELMEEAYQDALARWEEIARAKPLFRGGRLALWLFGAWAALIGGIFLARYGKLLNDGYSISEKLAEGGLGAVLKGLLGL